MSEENNDLGDMAEDAMDNAKDGAENISDKASDALDSAKETAKDLGEKAGEKFDDAKDATKEFAEDAKEKASEIGEKASEKFDDAKEAASESFDDAKEAASEFADDVKKEANEFKENVKDTFSPDNPDSGKTIAILAHITIIGWIIAIIMNGSNKTEIGSYYIRQTLGIWIFMLVLGFVPLVGCFAGIIGIVLIIISLVAAVSGKMTPTVGVGHLFQDWFKAL